MDLDYLAVSPILIPFIIGVIKYKYIKSLKWMFYFVCYGVGNEIVSIILIESGAKNTMAKSHLYIFVSFVLLCLFYQSVFEKFINRKWFLSIIVFFVCFHLGNLFFIQSIYKYPSLPYSVSALIIVVLSIIYFYKVMVEAKIINLAREPLIWINTAVLIYFTGNLFYHILFNIILEYSRDFLNLTMVYFHLLNGLFYILIAVGFYQAKNKSIKSDSIEF